VAALDVSLFGTFCLRDNGQELRGFTSAKVQELLAYLLLNPTRHYREALAELLWCNSHESQQRKYLRQAIWQLQCALELDGTHPSAVVVQHDWIQLNAEFDLWLDVGQFERAFARVQGVPIHELDNPSVQAVQSAVDLYQGDLLAGCYEDWCLFERERLRNMLLVMLDKLMGYCEAHRHYDLGLLYGGRILRCDPGREHTHRRLMRLYWLSGDRTAALRQYQSCATALQEELGVKPSRSTLALVEQIRADRLEGLVEPPAPSAETARPTDANAVVLPEILTRLEQLRVLLTALQQQVQHELATPDHTR
jgi:DNA-binding SARP family transcriptional activator